MSISAKELRFDDHTMWVELADGRTLGVPLAWFPRLLHATSQQRAAYSLTMHGLRNERVSRYQSAKIDILDI